MTNLRSDPDHDAVVASTARSLVVTAPPGAGKTFLAVRLAGSIAQTLPPNSRVLLLTFSTQARTQLEREAERQLSPRLRQRIEVTNYHRFYWHAVRAYRRALGLPLGVDIGSRGRREVALNKSHGALMKKLTREEGLIESLAEHEFPAFRDNRTPKDNDLQQLLATVREEQSAGRLVFDDLGALFWALLEHFPSVDSAYRDRYPVVIADEHQDASALQDAIVRRFGSQRRIIFADPMQLIHEFRGAREERLTKHLEDSEEQLSLNTLHRWHGNPDIAEWLMAVRASLRGESKSAAGPAALSLKYTLSEHGFNAMKPAVRTAVAAAFDQGAASVAVLASTNNQVADLQAYLCSQHMYPRQIGTEDFEDARSDIERLPTLGSPREVALLVLTRIKALVPTLPKNAVEQATKRMNDKSTNAKGASETAALLLEGLDDIYKGTSHYFDCLSHLLDSCESAGHHLPRLEAVRAIRATAAALLGESPTLEQALAQYSEAVISASETAPRTNRGLFVMTVHQAKGKEFEAVILVDVSKRYWPDKDANRRLLYVAVTRATRWWTIIAPDKEYSPLLPLLSTA